MTTAAENIWIYFFFFFVFFFFLYFSDEIRIDILDILCKLSSEQMIDIKCQNVKPYFLF